MDDMSDTWQSIQEFPGNSGIDWVSSTYYEVSIQALGEILILSAIGLRIPKEFLNRLMCVWHGIHYRIPGIASTDWK